MVAKAKRLLKNSRQYKDPVGTANIIVGGADPLKRLKDIAELEGVSSDVVKTVIERFRAEHPGFFGELKALKNEDITVAMSKRLAESLEHLTTGKMADASYRDLVTGIGILNQNTLLREGKPTQIISSVERANINDLLPALVQELSNRGMTVDLNPSEWDEEPGTGARVIPPPLKERSTAARLMRYQGSKMRPAARVPNDDG